MTPFGANLLLGALEDEARAETIAQCPAGAAMPVGVLLAGGFEREARDAHDLAALTIASYARTVEAAHIFQGGRVQRFIVSGGSTTSGVSEGAVMAELLHRLGVPPDRITLEPSSRTTWENAREVRSLWRAQDGRPLLITSAVHMPRASLAFQAAGLIACPAPTQWRHVPFGWSIGYFIPQLTALDKAEDALHEMVGWAAYRWRARGG